MRRPAIQISTKLTTHAYDASDGRGNGDVPANMAKISAAKHLPFGVAFVPHAPPFGEEGLPIS
jgi:hypothetical protein